MDINQKAYNNEELFSKFIDDELVPAFAEKSHPEHESLLLLDCASFHKTPGILQKFRENNIIPSIIPPGCTGLIQPLDTAINKPFKQYLREFTDAYIFDFERAGKTWTSSEKRIMTTFAVGQAWDKFCEDKREMIIKSFRDVGVTLPVDGSLDHELRIKGINNISVGNYTVDLPVADDFRELPAENGIDAKENDAHKSMYFEWALEDYVHTVSAPPIEGPII